MTKHVYSGQEVPHQFAADKTACCWNANKTLFCESGVLFSYRRSAPIAAWHGDKVLLNGDSFSVTTSKHQAWVRYAVNHLETMTLPHLDAVLRIRSERGAAEYIAARMKEIERIRESMAKMRAQWKKESASRDIANLEAACEFVWRERVGKKSAWSAAIGIKAKADKADKIRRYTQARNQLETGLENAGRIIERCRGDMAHDLESGRGHGLQTWWRLDNAVADIRRIDDMGAARGLGIGETATFADAAKIMGKKWAKECTDFALAIHAFADSFGPEIAESRKAYDAAERLPNAEKVAAWYAGQNVHWPLVETACRVMGDEVQTSRGARVPLGQALQLAELAKACRANGRGIDLAGRQIGSYRGTKIDAAGTLTVGCHVIMWPAIESALARYEESRRG